MNSPSKCILCQSSQLSCVEEIPTSQVISLWQEQLQINVSDIFEGYSFIPLYKCLTCHLQFFPWEFAGPAWLYTELQNYDWYYMPQKWEHDVALQDIAISSKILEVGCGRGDFVHRMCQLGHDARGIELNPSAVTQAKAQGWNVDLLSLEDLAQAEPESFDIVCHFQVLEHVTHPQIFIANCLKLLKPSGKLLICVPNNDTFIQYDKQAFLNMPPHHVSRWTKQVFIQITDILRLNLKRIAYEPLANYHYYWYARIQSERLTFLPQKVRYFLRRVLNYLLNKTFLPRYINGHSIYVVLQK